MEKEEIVGKPQRRTHTARGTHLTGTLAHFRFNNLKALSACRFYNSASCRLGSLANMAKARIVAEKIAALKKNGIAWLVLS